MLHTEYGDLGLVTDSWTVNPQTQRTVPNLAAFSSGAEEIHPLHGPVVIDECHVILNDR